MNIKYILPKNFQKGRKIPIERTLIGLPEAYIKSGQKRKYEVRQFRDKIKEARNVKKKTVQTSK